MGVDASCAPGAGPGVPPVGVRLPAGVKVSTGKTAPYGVWLDRGQVAAAPTVAVGKAGVDVLWTPAYGTPCCTVTMPLPRMLHSRTPIMPRPMASLRTR